MPKEFFPIRSAVTRLALAASLLLGGAAVSGCEAQSRVLQGKPRLGVVQEVQFTEFVNDRINTKPTLRKEPLLGGEEVSLAQVRQELQTLGSNTEVLQGMRVYGGEYLSSDERGKLAKDKNGNTYGGWTAIGYLTDTKFVPVAYTGENGVTRGKAIVLEPKSRFKK